MLAVLGQEGLQLVEHAGVGGGGVGQGGLVGGDLTVSVRLTDRDDIEHFLKFLSEADVGAIKRRFGAKVASIVDGQHRMGGCIAEWEREPDFLLEMPVMLYFGLTFIEEAELFNTINATQRKLPKALIETTRGDITEADSEAYAQQIRRIAFSLCREADSVWGPVDDDEQINMTGVWSQDAQGAAVHELRSWSRLSTARCLHGKLHLPPTCP